MGFKYNDTTTLSAHLRGDSHKYSEENLTYKLGVTKVFNDLTINLSEFTGRRHPDLFVLHGANSWNFLTMKPPK